MIGVAPVSNTRRRQQQNRGVFLLSSLAMVAREGTLIVKLESFTDVRKAIATKGRPFHLMLGNGFSMSYDPGIFSYNALHGFVDDLGDDLLSKLFEIVNTKDFEIVLRQLENFRALAELFSNDHDLKDRVGSAALKLRRSLVDAIGALHPEHVFTVPQEKSDACARFLKLFLDSAGSIYTTNYDLLLYWVLMRNKVVESVDGFGRDRENPDEYVREEEVEYSELRWGKYKDSQRIFYVHGALPLFDTGLEIVKEEYSDRTFLLNRIKSRIENDEYPVFVTAGDGKEKLTHIRHNRYLDHAYESLARIEGSLVTFGFNFGPSDSHIIDAINRAAKHGKKAPSRLWSAYIGVYSEHDRAHIEAVAGEFRCKVHIFDAKTTPVWGPVA